MTKIVLGVVIVGNNSILLQKNKLPYKNIEVYNLINEKVTYGVSSRKVLINSIKETFDVETDDSDWNIVCDIVNGNRKISTYFTNVDKLDVTNTTYELITIQGIRNLPDDQVFSDLKTIVELTLLRKNTYKDIFFSRHSITY